MSPDPEKNSIQIACTDQEESCDESKYLEQDKQAKKELLIQVITSLCNGSSDFDQLRMIGSALEAGDELNAHVISGGCTNYSYKVFLEGDPSTLLYAKVSAMIE